jgi:hypothetical protein
VDILVYAESVHLWESQHLNNILGQLINNELICCYFKLIVIELFNILQNLCQISFKLDLIKVKYIPKFVDLD